MGSKVGGEEFAVVLPQTNPEEAIKLAERLINIVRGFTFISGEAPESLTISIGVTTSTMPVNVNALIKKADEALYKAKETRNTAVAM